MRYDEVTNLIEDVKKEVINKHSENVLAILQTGSSLRKQDFSEHSDIDIVVIVKSGEDLFKDKSIDQKFSNYPLSLFFININKFSKEIENPYPSNVSLLNDHKIIFIKDFNLEDFRKYYFSKCCLENSINQEFLLCVKRFCEALYEYQVLKSLKINSDYGSIAKKFLDSIKWSIHVLAYKKSKIWLNGIPEIRRWIAENSDYNNIYASVSDFVKHAKPENLDQIVEQSEILFHKLYFEILRKDFYPMSDIKSKLSNLGFKNCLVMQNLENNCWNFLVTDLATNRTLAFDEKLDPR